MIIVPHSDAGKYWAKSRAGSSALSIIRSQWSLVESHPLTASVLSSWLQARATFRKLCFAVACVLASIQKMPL